MGSGNNNLEYTACTTYRPEFAPDADTVVRKADLNLAQKKAESGEGHSTLAGYLWENLPKMSQPELAERVSNLSGQHLYTGEYLALVQVIRKIYWDGKMPSAVKPARKDDIDDIIG